MSAILQSLCGYAAGIVDYADQQKENFYDYMMNPGSYEFSEGVFSCCLVVEYLLLQEVFLVHFVDFVAVRLRCDSFAREQEDVVDDSICRPPNNGHNLLSMQLQFGEVFWIFILVQPPHGTPSVVA
uniref:Uncharacterized protein n=1 Tax=Heterorhabditis bacteriophora TaxID=37862 RepID=A0A1I7XKN8_HETBA